MIVGSIAVIRHLQLTIEDINARIFRPTQKLELFISQKLPAPPSGWQLNQSPVGLTSWISPTGGIVDFLTARDIFPGDLYSVGKDPESVTMGCPVADVQTLFLIKLNSDKERDLLDLLLLACKLGIPKDLDNLLWTLQQRKSLEFVRRWVKDEHNIDQTNCEFYNSSGESFDKIPFETLLPNLLLKYGASGEILEIGSGAGALAVWLTGRGCSVTCVEPAKDLAARAQSKGLLVHCLTIQKFESEHPYDAVVAISSLIHVPKTELPSQIEKIAHFLKPKGLFFVSFIEGETEEFEDPTKIGKLRFFAKWTESELDSLLLPYFDVLEQYKIDIKKMGCTFLLRVYRLKFLDAIHYSNV